MTSKQELFEKAINGLLQQGTVSYIQGTGCMYRGLNGTKCAVGHLIPDELYDPEIETLTFNTYAASSDSMQSGKDKMFSIIKQMGLNKKTIDFLSDLQQSLHDDYANGTFGNSIYGSLELSYRTWLLEQLPKFCKKHNLKNKWN
jgi:hypothetical protein